MPVLGERRYAARFASTPQDIRAAQALRSRCFSGRAGTDAGPLDQDRFDELCDHVLVEDSVNGELVCCFRLLPLKNGAELEQSYSAQFYGLGALSEFPGRMAEVGRFCIRPGVSDPDILRTAWAELTAFVDGRGTELLFGCSSFSGTDAGTYLDAFAFLKERHLAPAHWLPGVKSPDVFRFAGRLRRIPDRKAAMKTMPPLLRSYLSMGGWVSDHAVIDRDLNTLHVFTGLEVSAIPPARTRALRAMAV